jgi:hypothetical protein
METMRDLAARLDRAAARLASAARVIEYAGPSHAAFGVEGPGRLADVGYALHQQWVAATVARAREAELAGERLADVAAALRMVAADYADTDDAARRRHTEES